ncbi:MAG: hypothetical protein QOK19_2693 [Solirubrobacteraceae bacterium]|nr:hypothetical protein [Solirubrobacteraceae bacterium]
MLAAGDDRVAREVRIEAIEALTDREGGFAVGTSCGFVMVPRDAVSCTAVLQAADERLYAEKERRRSVRARCHTPAAPQRDVELNSWAPTVPEPDDVRADDPRP